MKYPMKRVRQLRQTRTTETKNIFNTNEYIDLIKPVNETDLIAKENGTKECETISNM